MSASAYDPPKRINVIQVDLPTSTTKNIEHTIDPRTQITPDLKLTSHGINPVKTKFLQVEVRPEPVHSKAPLPKDHAKAKEHHPAAVAVAEHMGTEEALEAARHVEMTAKKLSEGITVTIYLFYYNNNFRFQIQKKCKSIC